MKLLHLLVLAVLLASIATAGCAASQQAAAKNAAASNPPLQIKAANPIPALSANNSTMKVIGMIGGVSWYSSAEYYRMMNEMVNDRLGDPHSAKIILYSINFADVSGQVKRGNPDDLAYVSKIMVNAAKRLEWGGADFIIIGSNTMNAFVPQIEGNVSIPVLNIADATGAKVKESGVKKVILLGSKIVMEQGFYRDILEKKYGLAVILPNESEREKLNSIIFDELVVGNYKNESRDKVVGIINRLEREEGAQGAILGCTELPLLIKQKDVDIPVFDTTTIHAEAAVNYAMGKGNFTSAN